MYEDTKCDGLFGIFKCEEKLEQLQLASKKISEGQGTASDSKRLEVSHTFKFSSVAIACRNF